MCGLAGLLLASPRLHGEQLDALVRPMGAALRHRGPDDAGTGAMRRPALPWRING